MKKKPKGRKYRNLFNRDGVIYYERRVGGTRVKFSCKTDNWTVAAQVRDLWEEKHGTTSVPMLNVPTFGEVAAWAVAPLDGRLVQGRVGNCDRPGGVLQLRASGTVLR